LNLRLTDRKSNALPVALRRHNNIGYVLVNMEKKSVKDKTRSTGTVHTSAKARLASVAIRIRICDPDLHQNLIISSFPICQPSLKISCKSVRKFVRKVANRQQTDKQRQKHILLGGSNDSSRCNNFSYIGFLEQAIIFSSCGFFLLLSSIFFPRLISAAACTLDVYHTSTHGVALV